MFGVTGVFFSNNRSLSLVENTTIVLSLVGTHVPGFMWGSCVVVEAVSSGGPSGLLPVETSDLASKLSIFENSTGVSVVIGPLGSLPVPTIAVSVVVGINSTKEHCQMLYGATQQVSISGISQIANFSWPLADIMFAPVASQQVTTTVATSSSIAIGASYLGGGAAAADAQAMVLLSLMNCASSFQQSVGSAAAFTISPYYSLGARMAVLLGGATVAGISLLQYTAVAGFVWRGWRKTAASRLLRFPSVSIFVYQFLMTGIANLSVVLLTRDTSDVADRITGVAGLVFVTAPLVLLAVVLSRLKLEYCMYTIFATDSHVMKILHPNGHWNPDVWSVIVGHVRELKFAFVVPAFGIVNASFAGFQMPLAYCSVQTYMLAVMMFVTAAFYIVCQPFRTTASNLFSFLSNAILATLAVLSKETDFSTVSFALQMCISCISVMRTIYVLWWKHHETEWRKLQYEGGRRGILLSEEELSEATATVKGSATATNMASLLNDSNVSAALEDWTFSLSRDVPRENRDTLLGIRDDELVGMDMILSDAAPTTAAAHRSAALPQFVLQPAPHMTLRESNLNDELGFLFGEPEPALPRIFFETSHSDSDDTSSVASSTEARSHRMRMLDDLI